MKVIARRLSTGLVLLSAASIWCMASAEEFGRAYFITESGKITICSPKFDNPRSIAVTLPGFVWKADLTPDENRILFAVDSAHLPIEIYNVKKHSLEDCSDLKFPPLRDPFREYMPLFVAAFNNRYVWSADEAFPKNTPQVLIDLSERKVTPLDFPSISILSPSRTVLSPDSNRLIAAGHGGLKLIDLRSARLVTEVSAGDNIYETLDVDWPTLTVKATWYIVQDRKAVQSGGTIDMNSKEVHSHSGGAPLKILPAELRARVASILDAYEQGISTTAYCDPLIVGRVASFVGRMKPGALDALTFTPRQAFLSPGGRYLVAESLERKPGKLDTFGGNYQSRVKVIDVDTGKSLLEFASEDKLVSVCFH